MTERAFKKSEVCQCPVEQDISGGVFWFVWIL